MPELIGRDPHDLAEFMRMTCPDEPWRAEVTGPTEFTFHHDEGSIIYDLVTGIAREYPRNN